ncbi:MAG: L-rhamnose/proton symporter RhaT [Planctomycetota bacterium]
MLWGFIFLLLGAVCGGSFGLPSKYVPKDTPWENLWGPFFFFVTVLIPVIFGPLLVKDFYAIYSAAGTGQLILPLVFGFLWGLGSMTLGLSFAFIGLSLAYSLNYGAQIIFGAMAPMLIHHPDKVLTPGGYVILAGVAVCLLGVVVCGRAALLKERSISVAQSCGLRGKPEACATKQPRMLVGVIVGIVSGILCACYAVAASFSGEIGNTGSVLGDAFVVMALIVWGGAVSACLYCAVQLTRNRTWAHFAKPGLGFLLLLAAVMAVLHDGAILLFGLGYARLGTLGVSVGYAAFMSFAIIVGNVHGFRSGEWKGASRRSICWIVTGIIVLIAGVCILGQGNAMTQAADRAAKELRKGSAD